MTWRYLLVFFFITSACASEYDKCVTGMANQHIQLSDDSLWEIVGLAENKEQWQIGDPITCEVPLFTSQFFLTNLRTKNSLPVDLSHAQEANLKTYQIETICSSGLRLRLGDQSIWTIGVFGSCTSENWTKGNRLIVIPASDLEGFYFINIDRSDEFVYGEFRLKPEQVYRHFITDVLKVKNEYLIKLNSGFKFLVDKNFLGLPDDKMMANWQIGDEMNLFCDAWETVDDEKNKTDRFMTLEMTNLRTLEKTSIKYGKQNEEWISPKIVKKDVMSKREIFLTLDDGSFWKISDYIYGVDKWEVGDRLLISPNLYNIRQEKPYCLLNPDHGLRPTWYGFGNYCYSAAQGKMIKLNEMPMLREE